MARARDRVVMAREALENFIVDFMMGFLSVLMLYGAIRALCPHTFRPVVMTTGARVVRVLPRRRRVWSRRTIVRRPPLSPVPEEPAAPRPRANSMPLTTRHLGTAPVTARDAVTARNPVTRRHSTGAEAWCDEWVQMPRDETCIRVRDVCPVPRDAGSSALDTPRPSFQGGRPWWWRERARPVTQPLLFQSSPGGNIYYV